MLIAGIEIKFFFEQTSSQSLWISYVFITAEPIMKLFACGGGDIGGHVLRETTSRGLCGLVCPSRTSELKVTAEDTRGHGYKRARKAKPSTVKTRPDQTNTTRHHKTPQETQLQTWRTRHTRTAAAEGGRGLDPNVIQKGGAGSKCHSV